MNYTAIKPVRLLDTRIGNGLVGKLIAKTPRRFQIAGRGGIPAGATAITGNLTVIGPSAGYAAYLDADPDANPAASTVNFGAGQTVGNGFNARLAADGSICLTYLSSLGQTADFIVDVTGYFTP